MQQRFQPLEREFDLPAQPVHGENVFRRVPSFPQRCYYDQERRRDQGARVEFPPLLDRGAPQGLSGRFGCLGRLALNDQRNVSTSLIQPGSEFRPGV